ncbi:tRNA pseudouridine(55) synthase [uncultured Thiomicrorhabdus sp.]
MTQHRNPPRQIVNGIVLLNKPAGDSSNGILQKVRKIFNAKKAGHTGALDPFATGLLPICLGEATKVSGLLLDSDKRYTATLKLGEQSDTGDTEGEIIRTASVPELSEDSINAVLKQFTGSIEQVPPMYSALKHQGKPLYWYARQGIEIERPARPITIYHLELVSFNANEIVFDVCCSKGTYVRTLGEDIAKALGTLGHLTALHRTQTGSLSGDDMLTLDDIEQQKEACLQPLDIALQHLPRIDLVEAQAMHLLHGGMLRLLSGNGFSGFHDHTVSLCVGEWHEKNELIKPKRLFNL